jgi:hypothetical protein
MSVTLCALSPKTGRQLPFECYQKDGNGVQNMSKVQFVARHQLDACNPDDCQVIYEQPSYELLSTYHMTQCDYSSRC